MLDSRCWAAVWFIPLYISRVPRNHEQQQNSKCFEESRKNQQVLEQLLLAPSIAQKRPVLSLCPDAIKKEIARRFWLEVADYKLLSPAFLCDCNCSTSWTHVLVVSRPTQQDLRCKRDCLIIGRVTAQPVARLAQNPKRTTCHPSS